MWDKQILHFTHRKQLFGHTTFNTYENNSTGFGWTLKIDATTLMDEKSTGYYSTYPKGGVSCYANNFVVAVSLVLRNRFSNKNPALRIANRYSFTIFAKLNPIL